MNDETWRGKLDTARERLAAIADGRESAEDLSAAEVWEDLATALEELEVAEEELRQQNEELAAAAQVEAERQRYVGLFEFSPDACVVTDTAGVIQEANRPAATLFGVRHGYLVSKPLVTFVNAADRTDFLNHLARLVGHKRPYQFDVRLRSRPGVEFSAAVHVAVRRNAAGQPTNLQWTIRDITERERMLEVLRRANRIHAASSRINEVISRLRDPRALYEHACRIALEEGGFVMAWVGTVDAATGEVSPVAWDGAEDGYLTSVRISADEAPEGQGPTGTAARTGRYDLCQDFETDPRMGPWREAALARGYRSSGAFPLKMGGETFGVLTLYAAESAFFGETEVALLDVLADDIARAAHMMDLEQQQRQAQRALDAQSRQMEAMFDATLTPLVLLDRDFNFVRVNQAYADACGRAMDDLVGRNHFDLYPSDAQPIFERVVATKEPFVTHARPFVFPDDPDAGTTYWDWSLVPVLDERGETDLLVFSLNDVTELVRTEAQVRRHRDHLEVMVGERTAELRVANQQLQEEIAQRDRAEAAREAALAEAQARNTENEALLEGARAILADSRFEDAAGAIIAACRGVVGAAGGFVCLHDELSGGDALLFSASDGQRGDESETCAIARDLGAEVMRTGEAVRVDALPDRSLTNLLLGPMTLSGETVGLVGLANKPGGFTDRDSGVLAAFSDLAALALSQSQAFEALEGSEKRFRSFAESASAAIISADTEGRIFFWNRAAEDIFGYTEAEAVGQPITLIVPEHYHVAHETGVKRFLVTGEPGFIGCTIELSGQHRSGRDIPIDLSLSTWQVGDQAYFTAIVHDVTQRHQDQRERDRLHREAEDQARLLQAIFDTAPIGLVVFEGEEPRVRWCNDIYATFFEGSYRDRVVAGASIYDFIPDADTTGVADILRRAVTEGVSFTEAEFAYPGMPRGMTHWRWSVLPLPRREGDVPASLSVLVEVTEQVQARQRIEELAAQAQESLTQLEAIIHNMSDGLGVVRADGEIVLFNPALLRMYRFPSEDHIPRTWGELAGPMEVRTLDGEPLPREEWPMHRALAGETYADQVLQVQRADTGAEYIASYSGTPVRNAAGEITMGLVTLHDVTEQIAAQRERDQHHVNLGKLLDASQEVLAEHSAEGLLQRVVDAARALTGARVAISALGAAGEPFTIGPVSKADDVAAGPDGEEFGQTRGGVYAELFEGATSIRYTQAGLEAHPRWWGLPEGHVPLNGLLGAALTDVNRKPCGALMVSHKERGEFTLEDEVLLTQLAALASLGLQHVWARTATERNAEELDAVFEAMADAVVVYDTDGMVVRANEAAASMYGRAPLGLARAALFEGLVMRDPDGQFVDPEDLPVAHAHRGARVIGRPMFLTNALGQEVRILASSAPLLVNGEQLGTVVVWHDVTEREALLAQVAAERARLFSVLGELPGFVCLLAADYTVPFANKGFRELFGDPEDRSCYELIFGRDHPCENCHSFEVLRTERAQQWQWEGPRNRVYDVFDYPFVDLDGTLMVLEMGIDITDRQRAAEKLRQYREHLEELVAARTRDLSKANTHLAAEVDERAAAQRKLVVYQKHLRDLAAELSLAEESERRRIATDIHDYIGQSLAFCRMKLGPVREAVGDSDLALPLAEVYSLLDQAVKWTRTLTFELSPPMLYDLGLEAAIEWLLDKAGEQHALVCRFEDDRQDKPIADHIRVLLFQAARELVSNVGKHAQARHLTASISRRGSKVHLEVADDGIGFDVQSIRSAGRKVGGFGLFNIRERLKHLGGIMDIESRPGEGTRVAIDAPLTRRRPRKGGAE